jgi:hypothetical protein
MVVVVFHSTFGVPPGQNHVKYYNTRFSLVHPQMIDIVDMAIYKKLTFMVIVISKKLDPLKIPAKIC